MPGTEIGRWNTETHEQIMGELGTVTKARTGREQRKETEDMLTSTQGAGAREEYRTAPGEAE